MTLEQQVGVVTKDNVVSKSSENQSKFFKVEAGAIFIAPAKVMPLRRFYRV